MSNSGGNVPTQVTQIEMNGDTVTDFDPDQVPFHDQEQIIRDGLQQRGWSVNFLQGDQTSKRRLFKISKGGTSFSVVTYIFSNLAWSSGKRAEMRG